MAIAILLPVTVSIAAEIKGTPSFMFLVRWVEVSTSEGKTLDAAGTKSTSSKVKPSRMRIIFPQINNGFMNYESSDTTTDVFTLN